MNFTDNAPDDASVIHNILRGNINSFEILMDRYQDHVSRIVRNIVCEVHLDRGKNKIVAPLGKDGPQ